MFCKQTPLNFSTSPRKPTYLPIRGFPRASHKELCNLCSSQASGSERLPWATHPPQHPISFVACPPPGPRPHCPGPATLVLQMGPLGLNLPPDAHRAGVPALNAPASGPAPSPVLPLFCPPVHLPGAALGLGEGRLLLSGLTWPSDSSQRSMVSCSPFVYPGGRRPLLWIPGRGSQAPRTRSHCSSLAPVVHEQREKTDGISEKSHPSYLGSKGQNLCSDRGGQKNGEFQCGLSLAADFAAESGSVTAPGRMPQEAWAAFAGLTTAPAQNRHGGVQALGLTLTRVFLSLTRKLIRSLPLPAPLFPPHSPALAVLALC